MKVSKGSVYSRKDSPYLWLNFSINGKRKLIKTPLLKDKNGDDKRAKEELLPLFRSKILSGELSFKKEEVSKKTFSYYSELYLEAKDKELKPSTLKNTRNTVNRWNLLFGKTDITDIRPSEIKKALLDMNVSIRTAKLYLSVVRNIFNEAVLDEVIEINPCDKFKLKGNTKIKDVFPFEKDEVARILDSADGWFKNFLAFAFMTGCRTGEIMAMKWQNIDFNKKRIFVNASRGDYVEGSTKTNKARYIPLFDSLLPYLYQQKFYTGMKEYVFLTDYGKNIKPSNLREQKWIPLLRRLSIPYRTLYQTRHTFATTMLNDKLLTMNEIAKILGHTSINMLIQHYNRYIEDELTKIDTKINPFCNDFCNDSQKDQLIRAIS